MKLFDCLAAFIYCAHWDCNNYNNKENKLSIEYYYFYIKGNDS
jgi:hypothetical protein